VDDLVQPFGLKLGVFKIYAGVAEERFPQLEAGPGAGRSAI
jgi:hypothetical protein